MKIGVIFPQTEIIADASSVSRYAQEVERMGFSHVRAYDHVLGANRASRPGWFGYHSGTPFQEPLVLFSYMAGLTRKLRFITNVIILPQRQTVLVAKQAACLDVLSNGRLELGVGVGWNQVEYEGLGLPFRDRAKRYEDQVEVLRALWSNETVTIQTPWHTIRDAGINPLPIQRPIPIWMGGPLIPASELSAPTSESHRFLRIGESGLQVPVSVPERILRRIARMADGWSPLPQWQPDRDVARALERFRGYCREYGRDPATISIEGTLTASGATRTTWAETAEAWRRLGVTHLGVQTMEDGLTTVDQHLQRLEEVRASIFR